LDFGSFAKAKLALFFDFGSFAKAKLALFLGFRVILQKQSQAQNFIIIGKPNLTMVEINITTISSKGQIVIPHSMRHGIAEGEQFIIIENAGMYILKKASDYAKSLRDDIEFAKRTEKAYLEVERGKYTEQNSQDFLKKVRKNAR
jgi:AbrB family looped-hinge helix DNA binding protein